MKTNESKNGTGSSIALQNGTQRISLVTIDGQTAVLKSGAPSRESSIIEGLRAAELALMETLDIKSAFRLSKDLQAMSRLAKAYEIAFHIQQMAGQALVRAAYFLGKALVAEYPKSADGEISEAVSIPRVTVAVAKRLSRFTLVQINSALKEIADHGHAPNIPMVLGTLQLKDGSYADYLQIKNQKRAQIDEGRAIAAFHAVLKINRLTKRDVDVLVRWSRDGAHFELVFGELADASSQVTRLRNELLATKKRSAL